MCGRSGARKPSSPFPGPGAGAGAALGGFLCAAGGMRLRGSQRGRAGPAPLCPLGNSPSPVCPGRQGEKRRENQTGVEGEACVRRCGAGRPPAGVRGTRGRRERARGWLHEAQGQGRACAVSSAPCVWEFTFQRGSLLAWPVAGVRLGQASARPSSAASPRRAEGLCRGMTVGPKQTEIDGQLSISP